MILPSIFIILIGWLVGVHAPWWGIVALYGVGVYSIHKDRGGLESVYLIAGWVLFMVTALLSSFIFGELTFEWLDLKWLFTGE
tara:strand:+ start:17117 stop:17365 length:249 start_codon:yes stop_codon:yes gene_type:complete